MNNLNWWSAIRDLFYGLSRMDIILSKLVRKLLILKMVGHANGVLCFCQDCIGYYHIFTAKQTKSPTLSKLHLSCMKLFTNLIVFVNIPINLHNSSTYINTASLGFIPATKFFSASWNLPSSSSTRAYL